MADPKDPKISSVIQEPSFTQGPTNQAGTEHEDEGVCFTAGLQGNAFGAGVIHAYLAAARKAPRVVAGISCGALTSAAFQRAYQECLKSPQSEDVRWQWYRRYLQAISEKPFDVVWSGIPDQSDFFAELTPVKDPVPGTVTDPEMREHFHKIEAGARRDLTLFVELGHWLAQLPITVSSIAKTVINYVRYKESYGRNPLSRFCRFQYRKWALLGKLVLHNLFHPHFVREADFGTEPQQNTAYHLAMVILLTPALVIGVLFSEVFHGFTRAIVIGSLTFLVLVVSTILRFFNKKNRPLLGWAAWGACLTGFLLAIAVPLGSVLFLLDQIGHYFQRHHIHPIAAQRLAVAHDLLWAMSPAFLAFFLLVIGVTGFIIIRHITKRPPLPLSDSEQAAVASARRRSWWKGVKALLSYKVSKWIAVASNVIFENLNLHKNLVHNYYLRVALYELFRNHAGTPRVSNDPFPAVLVAAPLQVVDGHRAAGITPWPSDTEGVYDAYQIWALNGSSLVDALTAALSVPGLYEPVHLPEPQKQPARKPADDWWLPQALRHENPEIDLVDAAVIRQNPIPALFNFIAHDTARADKGLRLAEKLSSDKSRPRIHVVYSVPINPRPPQKLDCNASIVDVGLASLKLSRRRDTQMEVHQTNLLGHMEAQVRKLGLCSERIQPIFVDEIAPEDDPQFKNPLNPTRDEVLGCVAAGCRSTLQVLYADDLAQLRGNSPQPTVACSMLMARVSGRREHQNEIPGLPEVCQACHKNLQAARLKDDKADVKTSDTWSSLQDYPADCSTLPQLSGEQPRVVFVASGGVFRGTFHGGMLAALITARIKPDLVVGASVGTIMGGALAAAFSADNYRSALLRVGELTSVLLSVDKQIAFTKPFKNAVRDLGIRARSINISPNDLRKMVLHGSRDDASYAAVGAPSALIDGLSHLLLIPHKRTAHIASEFIAGHVTAATKSLLSQLKRETLKRLDIEYALIGSSLIQPVARRLLSAPHADLSYIQPYQRRSNIAVYGTTIDFWAQRPVLLGVNVPNRGPLYDFVEAALCSSAFPCVFSARRESNLYPGTGSSTTLFCDGGMFDNLPFLPAAEILAKVQVSHIQHEKDSGKNPVQASMEALQRRSQNPDLFIAGSLDVNLQAQKDLDNEFDNIVEITQRASALQNNVKIKSFEQVLLTLDRQMGLLRDFAPGHPLSAQLDWNFIDRVVNAAVLPVYPADPEHLNGTFAFCASTGMKHGRLQDSIADGCFQTLRGFADPAGVSDLPAQTDSPLLRSVAALKECGKVPEIKWYSPQPVKKKETEKQHEGECQFFRCSEWQKKWPHTEKTGKTVTFKCPFYQAADELLKIKSSDLVANEANVRQAEALRQIYERCTTDEVHIRLRKTGDDKGGSPPPGSAVPEQSAAPPATVVSR